MRRRNLYRLSALCLLFSMILTGCGGLHSGKKSKDHTGESPRDNTPQVLVPAADGSKTYGSEVVDIDASHTDNGYIMVKYKGSNETAKMQLVYPDQTTYTYLISGVKEYQTFPLSGGNGTYKMSILECIEPAKDLYAIVYTKDFKTTIIDEFTPFLYPNQYVNFDADDQTVALGAKLVKDCYCDLEAVQSIYTYVIKNITYDEEKAKTVQYGYLPVNDDTLASGKGICFDYAALMAAMLRSQRIPTKLEVGYVGDVLHSWISVYLEDIGWVDDIIEFDGKNWTLMDPTLGATNDRDDLAEYIGDGNNYELKFSY